MPNTDEQNVNIKVLSKLSGLMLLVSISAVVYRKLVLRSSAPIDTNSKTVIVNVYKRIVI